LTKKVKSHWRYKHSFIQVIFIFIVAYVGIIPCTVTAVLHSPQVSMSLITQFHVLRFNTLFSELSPPNYVVAIAVPHFTALPLGITDIREFWSLSWNISSVCTLWVRMRKPLYNVMEAHHSPIRQIGRPALSIVQNKCEKIQKKMKKRPSFTLCDR